jgi:hypothetical protein
MIFLMILALFAAAVLPSLIAFRALPRSRPLLRYVSAVAFFALLVSPSFLAGGVLALPVPFGAVLVTSAADLQLRLVPTTLSQWPAWHAVAFPVTALVGALIFRKGAA